MRIMPPDKLRSLSSRTLVALLLVVACSKNEQSREPTAPPRISPPERASGLQSYSNNGNITIVGEDGIEYTLRVIEREIWFSTGESLVLNGDQFDAVYAEFLGTIEGDRLVTHLQVIPTYSDPNCIPDPEAGVYCTYLSVPTPPDFEGDISQVLWRYPPDAKKKGSKPPEKKRAMGGIGDSQLNSWDGGHEIGKASGAATPVSFASLTPQTFSFAAATAYQSSPHCNYIASLALQATADYAGKRTGWIQDVFQTATLVAAGVAVRRVVVAGSVASAMLAGRMADRVYSRTRMSLMAVDWNSYYCRNYHIETGPIWMSGAVLGGGGGGTPYCIPVSLQISFDGGASYTWVVANVCYIH